jgi:hypothetical protein
MPLGSAIELQYTQMEAESLRFPGTGSNCDRSTEALPVCTHFEFPSATSRFGCFGTEI